MMMRPNVVMLSAATAMLVLPIHQAGAQSGSPCAKTGFAFVSSGAILASIPAYMAADSQVQKDVAAYKVELAKLKGDLDSASQTYSDKSTLLNATQKAAEIKKLQARSDAFQQRQADLTTKVTQREEELLQPIRTRVQAVLDGMRAEFNCAVVFDVTGVTGGLGIASADKSFDLTERVIERLKSATATKPAPGKP